MNFEKVFELLLEKFEQKQIDFALIGGFALQAAGHARATNDIDFLVNKNDAPTIKQIMFSLGYELIHQSEDVSNFVGSVTPLGRVDYLHAHRQYALKMLERAKPQCVFGGKFKIKVVTPEDLIGLKVQSSSNDPTRYHQDMADIESVLRVASEALDTDLIKDYFKLFERENECIEMLKRIKRC